VTAPAPERRSPRPFVGPVLGLVALVLVPVVWLGATHAQDDAASAATELDEARGLEAAAEAAGQVLQRAERALEESSSRYEALRTDQTGWADATDAEQAALAQQLSTTTAEADALSFQLAARTTLVQQQKQGAAALGQCTTGLNRAFQPLREQRRDAGLTELQNVIDTCRRAQAFLTTGNNDAQFPFDFADPFVVADGHTYYGYATNAIGGNVQLIRSTDLKAWTWVGEALPALPDWAEPKHTWAPAVLHLGDRWLLYYTARHRDTRYQCLGVAVSSKPTGPFADPNAEPLTCQDDQGGSIDASPFVDEAGHPFLVWKSEGETLPRNRDVARLWTAPLTDDGLHFTFFPTQILAADRTDEARVVEGPAMTRRPGGRYLLTYSTNRWDTADYRVDYATCDTPVGPCTKPPDNTLLRSDDSVTGPGGADFLTTADGRTMLTYHAWGPGAVGFPNPRPLYLARLTTTPDGKPLAKPGL